MKIKSFALLFIISSVGSAYCGGLSEEDMVNVKEISLEHIIDIEVLYRWEKIIIRQSDTDAFIIKEYMNRNNPDYYAHISNMRNKLTIERGQRPIGIFINTFNVRAEVFIPRSYTGTINIKTTSGGIEAVDDFTCQKINIESTSGHIRVNNIAAKIINMKASSGSIRCEMIEGNIALKTTSGGITIDDVDGDVSAEASSGRIKFEQITGSLTVNTRSGGIRSEKVGGNASAEASSGNIDMGMVNGNIIAKTTSGSIRCSASENTENISLVSSSGGVTLDIPRSFSANFSSRTSSGRLSTPFSEKLFSPVSDRKSVQGITREDNPTKNINIKTNSGSIRVNWII
jgi:DUF4097 and DUF4098 domain-containing protein YvlB